MDNKDFCSIDQKIKAEIPEMTDDQLVTVEVWGELSKREQDKRFPARWESQKLQKC